LANRTVVFGDVGAAQQRRALAQRLGCPVLSRPILVHELLDSLEALVGSLPA
jgi:hypothetical protein